MVGSSQCASSTTASTGRRAASARTRRTSACEQPLAPALRREVEGGPAAERSAPTAARRGAPRPPAAGRAARAAPPASRGAPPARRPGRGRRRAPAARRRGAARCRCAAASSRARAPRAPRRASASRSAAARRDLPMPASPRSSTTWPSPAAGPAPAPQQQLQLLLAPDQRRGVAGRAQRLEAALDPALAERAPGAHRRGQALQPPPRRGRPSRTAPPSSRRVASSATTAPGLGHRLQPGGEVGRLAHHAPLARLALAQHLAHHHRPGGDADARGQRPRRGLQPRDRLARGEAGAHGALGVVLVRLAASRSRPARRRRAAWRRSRPGARTASATARW